MLDVVATVCNYNGATFLGDCLRSLLSQTLPPREIVVYDNQSTDDSLALVAREFPQIRVVSMGSNDGPCPVRNRGLREADSEWVLQVDSDVILEADCLAKLAAEAQSAANTALVMPRALFDGDRQRVHYDGGYFHYIGVMTLRNFFQPRPSAPEEAQDIDAAISMALLVRREPVLATGGYDPNYFILFEDHDLSYRLRAQGHRIRLVPDALVYHREGTAGISYREGPAYPQRRAFLHSRNRWMVLIRNHSLPALCWGMPGILGYELVWMAFATVRGLLGSYLRGKGALLKLLPQLLRERHGIQRQRKVRDRLLLKALPLTHAPMVKASAMARGFDQCLNAMLRTWWRCVSLLLP